MNLNDFELNHSSTVPVAYEPFGSEPDLPNNFYSDPYPKGEKLKKTVKVGSRLTTGTYISLKYNWPIFLKHPWQIYTQLYEE